MSTSLFGFSAIGAFICTLLLFIMMLYVMKELLSNYKKISGTSCISTPEYWVIVSLICISTILNCISAFGWKDDDNKDTRVHLMIFPFVVTFSCWIYLIVRFGAKRKDQVTIANPLSEVHNCRQFISGYMRSFLMMIISASFIFHIQCFI